MAIGEPSLSLNLRIFTASYITHTHTHTHTQLSTKTHVMGMHSLVVKDLVRLVGRMVNSTQGQETSQTLDDNLESSTANLQEYNHQICSLCQSLQQIYIHIKQTIYNL